MNRSYVQGHDTGYGWCKMGELWYKYWGGYPLVFYDLCLCIVHDLGCIMESGEFTGCMIVM